MNASLPRWPFALAAVAALAATLAAQPPKRVPIRAFKLLEFSGELFLKAEVNSDERSTGVSEDEDTQQITEEGIELDTSGYIYHPNLLEWMASARLGVTQEVVTANSIEQKTNGNLLGYDLSLRILREKPFTFRAFASQSEDLRDRSFGRSLKNQDQRVGVEANLKGRFPALLRVESTTRNSVAQNRVEDDKSTRLAFTIADERNSDWDTRLRINIEDTQDSSVTEAGGRTFSTDLTDERREAVLTNYWRFGPSEQQHSLRGQIRGLDRKGFHPNRRFSADQQLDLAHSETLTSYYSISYDYDTTPGLTDRTIQAEAGFDKRIYESLDLAGTVSGADQKIGEGFQKNAAFAFRASYRKKTPIGVYSSGLGLGRRWDCEGSPNGQRPVRDESVTLEGITFAELSEPAVLQDTIIVTDGTGRRVFFEGPDYLVRQTGAVTEIARVATGDIGDGDAVLVDYMVRAAQNSRFTTTDFSWSNRLALKHLPITIYADFSLSDQELQSGQDPGNLERRRDFLTGAELEYKGFTLLVEHDVQDRELIPPTVTDRIRLDYRRALSRNIDLSAGALAERSRFLRPEEFGLAPGQDVLDTVSANVNVTFKVSDTTLVQLSSDYTRNQGRETSSYWRNKLSFEWRYRKLAISIDAGYDAYEQQEETGTSASIMFHLKREF